MEASVQARSNGDRTTRRLDSEKAQRIVSAMRSSVGRRGAAGSTFDHVAREAGVSRGLLHYYFGSKERLLVEVVRHDCDVRVGQLEQLLAAADSLDAIVEVLVTQLVDYLEHDAEGQAVLYEMFAASRNNEELQAEMGELYRRIRGGIAGVLEDKERAGVVSLPAPAEAVAAVLTALGDGVMMQVLSDPNWDRDATFELGIRMARLALGADS
jgi:AcrR family transcriptional regulator